MTRSSETKGERRDWHVLPRDDAPLASNGSAILGVARSLQAEAIARGFCSTLVAEVGQPHDLPNTYLGLRRSGGGTKTALPKFLLGVDPSGGLASRAAADVEPPTHVYLHNQPWLARHIRRHFPNSRIALYLHNEVMRRVPLYAIGRALSSVDVVIGVSQYVVDEFQARANLRKSCAVVPNGIDTRKFDEVVEKVYDYSFVGRVIPEKGLHVLLEAASHLAANGRLYRGLVVGGSRFVSADLTQYERSMRNLVDARGLPVTFTGPLPPTRVPQFLNASHLAVVPSVWQDPNPLTALEGMASRAALIATKVGGIPDSVCDGGLLVPPSSPLELASTMEGLMSRRSLREEVAERGRRRALERSWSSAYDKLMDADCV
jgi:glycosyltransferase involved in cell wall biosynthesis